MNLAFVIAQLGGGEGGGMQTLIMMGLIFVVFYFFMIRPQMKKQKEMRNFRNELQKGDKVVTTGGIYGKIADIQETTLSLNITDNVKIKVDKNSVLKDFSDAVQK